MAFKVIDKKTGKEADTYKIALKEDWAKCLVYCDIEGFALTEDGVLVLMDECGNVAYCPDDRFEIAFEKAIPPVEAKQDELLDYIKLSLKYSDELKEKYRNKYKESNSPHDLYYSHLFEGMAEAYDDILKKMGESEPVIEKDTYQIRKAYERGFETGIYAKSKEAIGVIEDLTKVLEDNGVIAQAPEIKEALKMSIEALKRDGESDTQGKSKQGEWVENYYMSCGHILRLRANVLEQKCGKCNRWSIKWADTLPYNFCPNCGANMQKGDVK